MLEPGPAIPLRDGSGVHVRPIRPGDAPVTRVVAHVLHGNRRMPRIVEKLGDDTGRAVASGDPKGRRPPDASEAGR